MAEANKKIAFGRPQLGQEELGLIKTVLESGRLVHGPATVEFEAKFAARIGAAHAISVSSCTAALHLCLHAQGIGPGDTVIVPAMTHVATAHAVEYCGARPVFCDVSPATGNIDVERLPAAIAAAQRSGRLRAIEVVHYLGLPCEMEPINALAAAAGATVIEDCALSLDATYGGRKTGVIGLAGCFSFYPVKHMTTIEGGMVTTNDGALAAMLRRLRAFGYDQALGERKRPGQYDVVALGYNYRMNEVEAAVGLAQLDKLDRFQSRRRDNHAALAGALAETRGLRFFPARHGAAQGSHYCFNVVLDDGIDRDSVVAELTKTGIDTSLHYPSAVALFTYYANKYGYRAGAFPVAERLAAQTISFGIGPHLEPSDMRRIADALSAAIRATRAG
jgi:dTDP-4-amino-4,6-dideoxygalactose transaminase